MQICGIDNTLNMPYSQYGGVWVGDHEYDFSAFDRQMKMFQKYAPEGYFMVMIVLDMPDWWMKENNCEYGSYYHLSEAYYEKKWIADATDYLKAVLNYAEETYGDRIFAYSISAGSATEWFDGNYKGVSPKKAEEFRKAIGESNAPIPTVEEVTVSSLPSNAIPETAI